MSSAQYVTVALIPGSSKEHGRLTVELDGQQEKSQSLESNTPELYAPLLGKRHVQVLFYGMFYYFAAIINICMPICLVAMTDSTSSINKNIPTYEWTQKGTIISVFFWGNMSTQLLGGWLSFRFGGKWVLVITNGMCSLLLLSLPTVIYTFGFGGIVTSRFIQGLLVGFTSSSVHSLLAKWAAPQERSSLATIVISGAAAGTMSITFISGYIAASWYGWPMVFYVLGSTQLLSSLSFVYFGYNSPEDHPTISEQEVVYINGLSVSKKDEQILSTPWTQILTSTSFMALVLAQCTYMLGLFTLSSEIPIYFSKVMELDMKSNSFLSTLPFLIKLFMGYLFSFMSDWLVTKGIISISISRKVLISLGFLVPCGALLTIGDCDKNDFTKVAILLVIGVAFLSAASAGHMVNHIDLSPNHAGTLMGIANQLAIMCSGIGILLAQYAVTDETDPSQWKIVFYSTAAVFAFSTIIFIILGSGKVQPWNESTSNT